MPKEIRCAGCGKELILAQKAIPQQGRIITVVAPHECSDETEELDFSSVLEPAKPLSKKEKLDHINSFAFAKRINEATAAAERVELKDSRPKREEKSDISSTAPDGLRGMALGRAGEAATGRDDPREYDGGEEMEG